MSDLLHRTVVVLNEPDGHADKRTRTILAQQFASYGLVVLRCTSIRTCARGEVIDVSHEMNPKTRRRFYEIAAAIAEHFSDTAQRPRKRRFRRGGMGSRGSSVS
jgi:MinD-like ATPase involved in chromosome partitioning or flagellar assembly